ncbi:MAG: methyl-accepting chemotaxis protein [Ignavibacteriales bacterium]
MKSLKQKVTLIFSIIIIFAVIVVAFVALDVSTRANNLTVKTSIERYLLLNSQLFENGFNNELNMLEILSQNEYITSTSNSAEKKIKYINDKLKNQKFISIAFVDSKGVLTWTNENDSVFEGINGTSFYKKILNGNKAISEPITKGGSTKIVYGVPVQYSNGDKGALFAAKNISILSDMIKKMSISGSGEMYIYDIKGNIIADKERNYTENLQNSQQQENGNSQIKQEILKTQAGSFTFKEKGSEYITSYSPINGTNWRLVITSNLSALKGNVGKYKIIAAFIEISIIFICVIVIYFLAGTITSKFKSVVNLIEKISEGDFTIKIPDKFLGFKDEVGDIARAIDKMQKSLSELMILIKDTSNVLASTAEETSATTEEIASSSENQSAASEQTLASMEELDSSINHIAKSVQEISGNINHVNALIQQMESMMNEVANIAEEVSTQSQNSIKATEIGRDAVGKTQKGMDEINEAVGNLVSAIKGLGKSAVDIGEIVDVIDDIAEQTNLLALNAAIEAARAGEHGKGFAVVAAAVRNLAEKSGEATKEITKLIRCIQDEVGAAVETAKEGAQQVEQGVSLAYETKNALETIREAVDKAATQAVSAKELTVEQSHQIKDVAGAAKNVNEHAISMSTTIEEQTASSSEVVRAVKTISESAAHIAGGTGDIASSTDSLTKEAQKLSNLISKFKLR